MTWIVEYGEGALQALMDADDWWDQHRPSSAVAFMDAVESLRVLLTTNPFLGGPVAVLEDGVAVHRRLIMRLGTAANYHLYWKVTRATNTVTILAVWHAASASRPSFGG